MKMILPGVLLAAMMGYMVYEIARIPVVFMTFPEAECQKVDSFDADHNCQNLPARYSLVWVGGVE